MSEVNIIEIIGHFEFLPNQLVQLSRTIVAQDGHVSVSAFRDGDDDDSFGLILHVDGFKFCTAAKFSFAAVMSFASDILVNQAQYYCLPF